MHRARQVGWGQVLGILPLLLLLLVGCGGSGGGGGRIPSGTSRLTLQLTVANQAVSRSLRRAAVPGRPRQAIDPRFITRLAVSVSAADIAVPITAEVNDITTDEVTVELRVPSGMNRRVAVTAFNGFDAVIFQGASTVDLTREVEPVSLTLMPEASTNPVVSAPVTAAAGGTLTVTDENTGLAGATLAIAPGALASDTTITIGTTNNPELLPPLLQAPARVGLVLDFAPSGTTFNPPATLTLPYDPDEVVAVGLQEANLRFFVLEEGASAWDEVTGVVVDTVNKTLTVPLRSFSNGAMSGTTNTAPVAGGDSTTVAEGGSVTGLTGGATSVLTNDTDAEGDTLTATLGSTVSHGTLTLNADGTFSYTHDGSETTSDSFTYTASDGSLTSASATVTLTITPVNDAPVAGNPGNQSSNEGTTVSLTINASDADGDSLTFSATGLPPGLGIDSTSGAITGTIASGATSGSPYNVTITVSDSTDSGNTQFTWEVMGPLVDLVITVRDVATNVLLDGVTVTLDGHSGVTDTSGLVTVTNVTAGTVAIMVTRTAYLTHSFDRAIHANTTGLNLYLYTLSQTTVDTDGDGLPDGVETNTGIFLSALNTGTDATNKDTDGDGLNDGVEFLVDEVRLGG